MFYRVGDTFRFGQSSRMYVLTGPQDLMPQEGLSKQQKKQLALLEAAQVCGHGALQVACDTVGILSHLARSCTRQSL